MTAPAGNTACSSVIRFGVFEVDVRNRELRKSGLRIRLQEQPFQVLLALLMRAGEVVSREELRDCLWPRGTFVDFDYALNTAVKKIRAALSDDASLPRYIETIPRRGYRFIGNINPVSELVVNSPSSGVLLYQHGSVPRRLLRRRLLGAALVGLALMAAAGAYFTRRAASHHPFAEKRILLAVVPFENLDGDSSQDPFCEGLTEELVTQLGRIDPQTIGVTARSTVTAYEDGHRSVAEIGRELRADYVLEGSIRRNENMVRVSARLIRTADQSHVWANEFDRDIDDVLLFQSDIAAAISRQVRTTVLSWSARGFAVE